MCHFLLPHVTCPCFVFVRAHFCCFYILRSNYSCAQNRPGTWGNLFICWTYMQYETYSITIFSIWSFWNSKGVPSTPRAPEGQQMAFLGHAEYSCSRSAKMALLEHLRVGPFGIYSCSMWGLGLTDDVGQRLRARARRRRSRVKFMVTVRFWHWKG